MSPGFWRVLPWALVVTLFGITLFQRWIVCEANKLQARNMQQAEGLLPAVRTLIADDASWSEVRVGVYTGQNGAIGFYGHVETPADLHRLLRKVVSKQLPLAIHWQVRVQSELP